MRVCVVEDVVVFQICLILLALLISPRLPLPSRLFAPGQTLGCFIAKELAGPLGVTVQCGVTLEEHAKHAQVHIGVRQAPPPLPPWLLSAAL